MNQTVEWCVISPRSLRFSLQLLRCVGYAALCSSVLLLKRVFVAAAARLSSYRLVVPSC